jgi:hypothetical protein
VVKFEMNKTKDELNNAYPPDREGSNGTFASKIDRSIYLLNELLGINDIAAIRNNYFARYRYTVSALFADNARFCWSEIRNSRNILENRVTEGDISKFKSFVGELINELEKLKEKYAKDRYDYNNYGANRNYDRILSNIITFNDLLGYTGMGAIRNSNYFTRVAE